MTSPRLTTQLAGLEPSPSRNAARRIPLHRRVLFLTVLYGVPLLLGELYVRWDRDQVLFSGSFREQQLALLRSAYPAEYDETLGFVPRPNTSGEENAWGTRVTIDERGFRSHPSAAARPGLILAVGDSFTFGDQVSDDETWPGYLEADSQTQVLNAGVFGYGFDQTVLRAEGLVPQYKPTVLIASIIDDDIDRCELSCRFAEKPYFDLVQGDLELRNVPVPHSADSRIKRLLGHSALADEIGQRFAPRWWRLVGSGSVQEHHQGLEVCEALLTRLSQFTDRQGVKLLLVVQARVHNLNEDIGRFAEFAKSSGVETLDLRPLLVEEIRRDPSLAGKWFHCHVDPTRSRLLESGPDACQWHEGHMRAAGNAWVAQHISERLDQLGWLDSAR